MGNSKSSSLPPQLVTELESMTSFSYAEINDLYRQFKRDCPDQKMTVTQFRKLYRETFPNGNPDKFAELVFQSFDVEQRGYIDFRQFLITLSAQLKGSFEEKLDWLFGLYDSEHAEYITRDMLVEMITAIQNLHIGALPLEDQCSAEEIATHILKHAGVEQTGRLSRKDFIRAAMTSNTLAAILQGTMKAADTPYLQRQERRGSLGIALHHGTHLGVPERRDSTASKGSGDLPPSTTAGATRRPSLRPDDLDFKVMLNKH